MITGYNASFALSDRKDVGLVGCPAIKRIIHQAARWPQNDFLTLEDADEGKKNGGRRGTRTPDLLCVRQLR